MIAQSQSGTGKTAAFAIAILSRINPSIQSSQALILAPTFELAMQIGSVIEKLALFLPYIRIAYAVPGSRASMIPNHFDGQLLSEPIVIGTPGIIKKWCKQKKIIDTHKLRILCIDEADYMMAPEGMQQACLSILNGLDHSSCQIMFFSSTYSNEIIAFSRQCIQDPLVLRLGNRQMLADIRHFFIYCDDNQQKYDNIEQMYANLTIGQTMIFCQTIRNALDLTMRLELSNHAVREIMSILDIEQRKRNIEQFRAGVFGVLIATNIVARGSFISIIFFEGEIIFIHYFQALMLMVSH